ncbi:MAG: DnaD domain protein [Clostridia bacterium]|nr:DnaD domain protein [Clostridia bacterium]
MSYKINPDKWNKIFAVPAEVVDKHIRLAGSAQLKVLLWTLRTDSDKFDVDELSKATGIAKADALDAMQFWVETGVVVKNGETVAIASEPPKADPQESHAVKAITPSVVDLQNRSICDKPTTTDIARRGQESPELRFLWNEAQDKLGKTLSFNDQRTLLWMHDHLGLPVEIILMIIEYCVSMDKRGIGYIEKVGISWAQEEIFSIPLAEQKLSDIKAKSTIWKKLREQFGIQNPTPTAKQAEFLDRWTKALGFGVDMIEAAFEECLNRTMKTDFRYINKVLESWHTKGFKTPKDIRDDAPKPAAARGRGDTSYSLDEFEQATLSKSIVYKKKKED